MKRIVPLLLSLVLAWPCAVLASDDDPPSSSLVNPYQRGCLYTRNLTSQIRVCGSEDVLPDDVENGRCRLSPYPEVRLLSGDTESGLIQTWILQIALTELLGVPTSLETLGYPLNFYQPNVQLKLLLANHAVTDTGMVEAFQVARNLQGDCTRAKEEEGQQKKCAHFSPETWLGEEEQIQGLIENGVLEPPQSTGVLGQEGWYIPRFTAERDPSLLTYIGLQNDENRQKLAQRFKRPTTWKDYCTQVSATNCTEPDSVAQRAPVNPLEESKMFAEGIYTGHFRPTSKNLDPVHATGHVVDLPCQQQSSVPGQLYHLNIVLDPDMESGGYTESQMIEIWNAANETKSDVIMRWWQPNRLVSKYTGSDAEFMPVTFPAPTMECLEAKPLAKDHCSHNSDLRRGPPEAVCGEPSKELSSLMSSTLLHNIQFQYDGESLIPDPIQSPSHAALERFRFSELQLEQVFQLWNSLGDPREAVCEWVSENMDYMQQQFVPESYPRVQQEQKTPNGALMSASIVLGGVVLALVLITFSMVHIYSNKHSIWLAQVECLDLLLAGSALLAIAAILIGAPSSNESCIAAIWLVNLGYTLEICPLLIKLAAINQVMTAGHEMLQVRLRKDLLFGAVALVGVNVSICLALWTILDPPQAVPEYQLSDEVNENGDTIVWVTPVCGSSSPIWSHVTTAWHTLLLLCSAILAIQMQRADLLLGKSVPCENTGSLALLVYSNLGWILLRIAIHVLGSSISQYSMARADSIIFSIDTASTLAIYFLPKLLAGDSQGNGIPFDSSSALALSTSTLSNQQRPRLGGKGKSINASTNTQRTVGMGYSGRTCGNQSERTFDGTSTKIVVETDAEAQAQPTTSPVDPPCPSPNNNNGRLARGSSVRRYSSIRYNPSESFTKRMSWLVVMDDIDLGYEDTGIPDSRRRRSSSEDEEVPDILDPPMEEDCLCGSDDEEEVEETIPMLKHKIMLLRQNNAALAEEANRQRSEIALLKTASDRDISDREMRTGTLDYSSRTMDGSSYSQRSLGYA